MTNPVAKYLALATHHSCSEIRWDLIRQEADEVGTIGKRATSIYAATELVPGVAFVIEKPDCAHSVLSRRWFQPLATTYGSTIAEAGVDMLGLHGSSNYWRKRAEYARHCAECARECAEKARSDRSKQKYFKIARKYDQEADRARERVKKRGSTVSDVTDLGADMVGLGGGSEYWRKRAQYARASAVYARARAEYTRGERSKQKYLRMAKKYDQQADLAEGVEKRARNRAAAA